MLTSYNKEVLTACYVPGTVLGTVDIIMKKSIKNSCFHGQIMDMRKQNSKWERICGAQGRACGPTGWNRVHDEGNGGNEVRGHWGII